MLGRHLAFAGRRQCQAPIRIRSWGSSFCATLLCAAEILPERIDKPAPFHKRLRLSDAAGLGMLVIQRCNLCRRTTYFLASDLVEVFGPDREAKTVHFACSRCQSADWIDVRLRSPDPGDYGHLQVRRPGQIVTTQLWRTVRLGDP